MANDAVKNSTGPLPPKRPRFEWDDRLTAPGDAPLPPSRPTEDPMVDEIMSKMQRQQYNDTLMDAPDPMRMGGGEPFLDMMQQYYNLINKNPKGEYEI